jgi:Fe-S-cluster containining protein
MNCEKCLGTCKAVCCGIVPLEKKFTMKHQPVRKVIKELDLGDGNVILETEDYRCPYLGEDFKCSVYKDRPEICRLYGNEKVITLTCQYQDKHGRIRPRPERREIERQIKKVVKKHIKS